MHLILPFNGFLLIVITIRNSSLYFVQKYKKQDLEKHIVSDHEGKKASKCNTNDAEFNQEETLETQSEPGSSPKLKKQKRTYV